MRSTSDSGIVLRSNWPLDEYDAESPALRPFISTSVVPRGNPRIWTVVEFAFPPPPMPFPSPIEISPLLLTETSDRYDSTWAILPAPERSLCPRLITLIGIPHPPDSAPRRDPTTTTPSRPCHFSPFTPPSSLP